MSIAASFLAGVKKGSKSFSKSQARSAKRELKRAKVAEDRLRSKKKAELSQAKRGADLSFGQAISRQIFELDKDDLQSAKEHREAQSFLDEVLKEVFSTNEKERVSSEEGRRRNISNVEDRLVSATRRVGFEGMIVESRYDREGGNWAALKPSTVKRRGSAHPILQVSGRLLSGAKKGVRNTFHPRKKVRWTGRTKFTNVPYARYHQFGTVNMVARTFYRNPGKKELRPAMEYYNKLVKKYIKTGKIG